MLSILFAASLTFTASATGVEKGTPLEFMFASETTDRDYETMFLIDGSIKSFFDKLDKCGFPRGTSIDVRKCNLWPVGVPVKLEPALETFVESDLPDGMSLGEIIFTAGERLPSGTPDAAQNMPGAVFAFYSMSQSPFLFNGLYDQGVIYGAHKVKKTLKKGEKIKFTVAWDEVTKPQYVEIIFDKTNIKDKLFDLRALAQKGEVVVCVGFDDNLLVSDARAIANSLSTIDSVRVKINGRRPGDFFFRAFLPLVKWRERQERLTQPFEVTIGECDKVVFIEEDWSGEGTDPKLTEKVIDYKQMSEHRQTDTVFFYAQATDTVGRLKKSLAKVPVSVHNHYVYCE